MSIVQLEFYRAGNGPGEEERPAQLASAEAGAPQGCLSPILSMALDHVASGPSMLLCFFGPGLGPASSLESSA